MTGRPTTVSRAGLITRLVALTLSGAVIVALAFGMQSGSCASAFDGGNCGSAPVLGVPGAWLITILALGATVMLMVRAWRRYSRRGTPPGHRER